MLKSNTEIKYYNSKLNILQPINSFKLIILALVVCSNVFSQSNIYKSFPNGSAIWYMSKQSASGLNYYNYKISGDTLIGAYTYKKVLSAYNITPGPFNFSAYTFNFAYRNDSINKKVYYLDATSGLNKDTLWYDFNLNIGDTVPSTFSYGKLPYDGTYYPLGFGPPNNRVVQSIDSILICGVYHKRFNFNCIDYDSGLIEGAGYMDNFIHTQRFNDCLFEPFDIYSSGLSTCYFTSIAEYSKDNEIKLYPNPTSTELKINSSLQINEYTVVNNIGSVILNGNLSESQSINVASLSNGLYTIKMQDKSGNNYQSKFIKQ